MQNRPSLRSKLLMALALMLAGSATASSHREAPFITTSPKVDGTDFYMFRSYEAGRQDYVTLIANYLPLQDAYGGPNYFSLDPNALYEIHIDNNGDAKEDLTFQFRFSNTLAGNGAGVALPIGDKMVNIPLIQAGQLAAGNTAAPGDAKGVANIRLRQANGRIRCIKVHYRKEASPAGVVLDLLLQDAKSLKRTMLDASMMVNFKAMMESTDDFIYFKDANSRFRFCSQTLANITGLKLAINRVLGRDLSRGELVPTALIEPIDRLWSPPASSGSSPRTSVAATAACTLRFQAATSARCR